MPLKIGLGWKIILSFREDYFFAFQVAQAIGVVFGFVDVGRHQDGIVAPYGQQPSVKCPMRIWAKG